MSVGHFTDRDLLLRFFCSFALFTLDLQIASLEFFKKFTLFSFPWLALADSQRQHWPWATAPNLYGQLRPPLPTQGGTNLKNTKIYKNAKIIYKNTKYGRPPNPHWVPHKFENRLKFQFLETWKKIWSLNAIVNIWCFYKSTWLDLLLIQNRAAKNASDGDKEDISRW